NPTITSLTHSSSEFTAEFYMSAARKLNAGGMFCQRIQHSDQGIDVFLDSIATMGSVFPHMTTINFMPGETLLVGRLDREFGTMPELPERLQAEHVGRVLARCGWDWGNLIGIPMLPPAVVKQISDEQRGTINR